MRNIDDIKECIYKIFSFINVAGMSVSITDRDGVILSENYGTYNFEFSASKNL